RTDSGCCHRCPLEPRGRVRAYRAREGWRVGAGAGCGPEPPITLADGVSPHRGAYLQALEAGRGAAPVRYGRRMIRARRRRSQFQEDLAALTTDRKRTRFLLDANSDVSAFRFLADKGYDVIIISRPKLGDLDVWKIAKQTGRVLVTNVRDFWADRFTL